MAARKGPGSWLNKVDIQTWLQMRPDSEVESTAFESANRVRT